jgi:hypothetical protein
MLPASDASGQHASDQRDAVAEVHSCRSLKSRNMSESKPTHREEAKLGPFRSLAPSIIGGSGGDSNHRELVDVDTSRRVAGLSRLSCRTHQLVQGVGENRQLSETRPPQNAGRCNILLLYRCRAIYNASRLGAPTTDPGAFPVSPPRDVSDGRGPILPRRRTWPIPPPRCRERRVSRSVGRAQRASVPKSPQEPGGPGK